MVFTPGQSGNPVGRAVGSRNRRTADLFKLLEERGDKKSVEVLSDIVTHSTDDGIRIAAATALAPYQFSKWQSSPDPRFIESPIEVPEFTTVEEASAAIAKFQSMVARGELDFQSAQDLIVMAKTFIDTLVGTELEARVALLEARATPSEDPEPT
jgi:hypothetical protein